MALRNFAEDIAEIGSQLEIASLVELIALQAGPLAINLFAAHAVADYKHRIRVAMVGAAVSVLPGSAAKLRHRQNHYVVHALTEIGVERRDRVAELLQQIAELTARAALVDVSVPAAHVGKRHLEPDTGFDQLRNLQQRIAKRRARILGAVLRSILRRINLLEIVNRLECFPARSRHYIVNGLAIDCFKPTLNIRRILARADRKIGEV